MSDIVERLREWPDDRWRDSEAENARLRAALEAKTTPGYEMLADTIVRRDAEIEQLRAALLAIADHDDPDEMSAIARRALEDRK